MKTVNIQLRWAAAHPGQDRRLPGVVTRGFGELRLDPGWGPVQPGSGSLSTGSPAGRALLQLKRGGGSMYSQAHVREGSASATWLERGRP